MQTRFSHLSSKVSSLKTFWFLFLLTLLITTQTLLVSAADKSAQDVEWSIECVDCPKNFSDLSDKSLRLDASGNPHIAYGADHLYYAWSDGTPWHSEAPLLPVV